MHHVTWTISTSGTHTKFRGTIWRLGRARSTHRRRSPSPQSTPSVARSLDRTPARHARDHHRRTRRARDRHGRRRAARRCDGATRAAAHGFKRPTRAGRAAAVVVVEGGVVVEGARGVRVRRVRGGVARARRARGDVAVGEGARRECRGG